MTYKITASNNAEEFEPIQDSKLLERPSLDCQVVMPGDTGYDAARSAWNLSVDQYPAVVVLARSVKDVSDAMIFANKRKLTVAVKATGHGVIRKADNNMLIDTAGMAGVRVDPAGKTAWIGAGTKWGSVLEQTQSVGLAPLLGSSPDVGAVGYTLGGGMGWLARKYGLSTDNVNYFDLVTVDGKQVRASATENADLFWGLRGGGGNFGIVTGMEIRLYPVTTVYGGNLIYPVANAREVYSHFHEWISKIPDELTASILVMNFPPFPNVPVFLRGQTFVMVRGCYCGPTDKGVALLSFWRDWQKPLVDDFKEMPFTQVASISNDPVDPIPSLSSGAWLSDLDVETVENILQYTIPHNGPPMLMFAEVRIAGGAIARVDPASTAFSNRDAIYSLQVVGAVPTQELYAAASQHIANMKHDLEPHLHGGVYLNFLEGEEANAQTRHGFSDEAFKRLREIKTKYDPDNILSHSFDVPPAAK